MRRALTVLALAALGLVPARLPAAAPAGSRPASPGVLLVTLDTTRSDRLGCYGHRGGLTPSLDRFAQQATLFELCEASTPQTMPSHATILSGLQANRHGVRKNLEVYLPPGIPSLPEEFASSGYRTAAFVSAYVLLARYGMGRGFERFDDTFYDAQAKVVERPATETLSLARQWILAQREPWFCWVHLFDPHTPYTPSEPFASRYPGNPYDGEIAAMDDALGKFFEALDKAGVLRPTTVVVCGDHGESLGEHGEKTHGLLLYESTTRIPLLVHRPGQVSGQRVRGPVGLVDLAPTLRELCGLRAVTPCDGVSLAPALSSGQAPAGRGLYLESLEGLNSFGWAPLYGRVEGDWKFILAPRVELYDLKRDPAEASNASAQNRERVQAMRRALSEEVGKEAVAPLRQTQLDAQELASLKSLGYIAGTPGKAGANFADPKDGIKDLPELERGKMLLETGRLAEAARVYEKVWARGAGAAQIALYLSICYESSDPERSLFFAKEAIRLRPDFHKAYRSALILLVNQHRFKEARQLADLSRTQTQDLDGTLGALGGWAAFMDGAPASEIEAALDRAAPKGGEGFSALKLRMILAQKRGDTPAAMGYLRRFLASAPKEELDNLGKDPNLAELRQEPEFWKVVLANAERREGPGS